MIPDLQKLVEVFGGYDTIPPEAWVEFDASIAAYHRHRRIIGDAGTSVVPARDDPHRTSYSSWEECVACYTRGIFGYWKKTLAQIGKLTAAAVAEPDELIWFCRSHMPAKHFADARRDT